MQFNRLTWCGIVVAVSWVVVMGNASWAYMGLQTGPIKSSRCDTLPPYPNQLTGNTFPFVTTDAKAQIVDFYYRYKTDRYGPFKRDFRSLIRPEFTFPVSIPEPMCRANLMTVEVHDYGMFRLATVYMIEVNHLYYPK